MPKVLRTPDFLERLAALEDRVAAMSRTGWERDELPFYPTSLHGLVYEDTTTYTTIWESIFTPRTASLAIGLVLIGDTVGVNTGGDWQLLVEDVVVGSGSVPPTFSYVLPALTVDLTPYRNSSQIKARMAVRRTSGASTGGRWGGGGSIGGAPRYARMI